MSNLKKFRKFIDALIEWVNRSNTSRRDFYSKFEELSKNVSRRVNDSFWLRQKDGDIFKIADMNKSDMEKTIERHLKNLRVIGKLAASIVKILKSMDHEFKPYGLKFTPYLDDVDFLIRFIRKSAAAFEEFRKKALNERYYNEEHFTRKFRPAVGMIRENELRLIEYFNYRFIVQLKKQLEASKEAAIRLSEEYRALDQKKVNAITQLNNLMREKERLQARLFDASSKEKEIKAKEIAIGHLDKEIKFLELTKKHVKAAYDIPTQFQHAISNIGPMAPEGLEKISLKSKY